MKTITVGPACNGAGLSNAHGLTLTRGADRLARTLQTRGRQESMTTEGAAARRSATERLSLANRPDVEDEWARRLRYASAADGAQWRQQQCRRRTQLTRQSLFAPRRACIDKNRKRAVTPQDDRASGRTSDYPGPDHVRSSVQCSVRTFSVEPTSSGARPFHRRWSGCDAVKNCANSLPAQHAVESGTGWLMT